VSLPEHFTDWVRADLTRHGPLWAPVTAEDACPTEGCTLARHQRPFNHRRKDGTYFPHTPTEENPS
jgi:hypothetical protein